MKKRTYGLLAAALVVASVHGARWLRSAPDSSTTPPPAESAAAPAPVESAPPERETSPAPPDAEPSGLDPERLALVRAADPELEERARQQALAPEADARWSEAVDEGGYAAGDLDAAVRELFGRLELEPRYAEGGLVEGLVIQSMPSDHPLARVGFRPGDRIERIQGTPLRDPAAIPSLLARLGPHIAFCVDRDGAELCREVHLE